MVDVTLAPPVDLSDLPAVDGHCHPLLPHPWDVAPARFLALFTEAPPDRMSRHIPHTGYFRRALRELAQRLATDATVDAILARRRQLGAEPACRSVGEGGVTALLADTGYPPEAMPLAEMRRLLPCAIHEVFRIETCAEALIVKGLAYEEFLEAFREALRGGARHAVAFKSIIAYRSGLAIRWWAPAEAAGAYRAVIARVQAGGSARLIEQPLLDTLLETALEVCRDTARPLQLHTGFGDPDIDLLQANPLLLRPVLEDPRWQDVSIVALHMAYPYHREAAYLASVWPGFHVDLSLAMVFLGAAAVLPLVEMLALAPASKLLYGSDVHGLPELFALSAEWGRASLGEALGWLVERGGITVEEGRRMGGQILSGNAATLYRLPS